MEQYICPLVKFVRLFRTLAVQEVIVQTMQCLEDKITCNEQINDNLAA